MDTELFGDIAAEAFLERLGSLSRATGGDETSSKHVVDYLSARERQALFGALANTCDRRVAIVNEEGDTYRLHALELGEALVIPFLVDDTYAGEAEANAGSSGFSCALRDYFSVGADRPRVLVTLTERGNETQDSAREVAVDRELLSLEALCRELADAYGFAHDSRMQKLIDRYLAHVPETLTWEEVLGRLDDFLEAVEGEPLEAWGAELDRLEVFLPDDTAHPIDGDRLDLTGREESERLDDTCRLDDNAGRRAFLKDAIENPLKRTRDQLDSEYDDESVEAIMAHGIEGDDGVTADALDQDDDRSDTSIDFMWSGIEVEGASQWERRSGSSDQFVLVTAEDDITVRVPLTREFNPDREYVHLFGRDRDNDQRVQLEDRAEAEGTEAVFEIPNDEDFSAYKLVLADGPRTFKMTEDDFFVVLSRADTSVERVAWETGVELSFEHQAWVREGETATFKLTDGEVPTSDSLERDDDLEIVESEPSPYDDAIVEYVSRIRLDEGRLPVRIAWVQEDVTESKQSFELLAFAPYEGSSADEREAFLSAMQSERPGRGGEAYLQSVSEITREGDDCWNVELDSHTRATVQRWNGHGQEEGIAALLADPTVARLERDSDGTLETYGWPTSDVGEAFRRTRADVFEQLLDGSPARIDDDSGEPEAVSLWLTDLLEHREAVERYLGAWLEMLETIGGEGTSFGTRHEALYRLDTLEQRDSDGELERLTLLPTHPWLLNAMLRFQAKTVDLFESVADPSDLETSLTRDELEEFAPKRILEDWYTPDQALRAEDGTPFCMEFIPGSTFERSGRLDYVSRVVRRKIDRYFRMHDHLRDERRTFRLAFVHPGDAEALLEGLEAWFQNQRRRDESWLEAIPTFEISLFEDGDEAGRDTAFDEFFRRYLESTEEAGDVEEAMLAKLRYRKRDVPLPEDTDDFSHICLARGLVERDESEPITDQLDGGWDGSFGDGLMATYLREPQLSGEGAIAATQRGLWIHDLGEMRRGLAHLSQLVEGQRNQFYNPGVGLFWKADLPSLDDLSGLYDHSDWVVHLDRELNLAMFHGDDDETRVIEYSDQEDPTQPGFDVITVTERAEPYFEQLKSVLRLVDLPKPSPETSASSRPDRASEAMRSLLGEINTLSGTWALDFLEGNVSDETSQNRLKGMVGAALVYRWLRRVEEPALIERFDGRVVPVYVSLEDLIRATPATGLPTGPGLVDRYGEHGSYCDDLLALYLQAPPGDPEAPLRLFGRIIEVKFGRSAGDNDTQKKGIAQVRHSHELMSETLAGGNDLLEAPIRHRQLSMLVKSQLEQARARGLLDESQIEALERERLSARLASGRYRVSYDLHTEQRNLYGDLFALSTSTTGSSPEGEPDVERRNGVRVITLGRQLLRDLAHASHEDSTLYGTLDSTLPHLGRPGRGPGSPPEIDRDETKDDSVDEENSGDDESRSNDTSSSDLDDLAADGGEETSDERFDESEDAEGRSDVASVLRAIESDVVDADMLERVRERGRDAIQDALQTIVSGEAEWREYHEWMADLTGQDQAPDGGPWGREKLLEVFEDFGFVREDDGVVFEPEVSAVDWADISPGGGSTESSDDLSDPSSTPSDRETVGADETNAEDPSDRHAFGPRDIAIDWERVDWEAVPLDDIEASLDAAGDDEFVTEYFEPHEPTWLRWIRIVLDQNEKPILTEDRERDAFVRELIEHAPSTDDKSDESAEADDGEDEPEPERGSKSDEPTDGRDDEVSTSTPGPEHSDVSGGDEAETDRDVPSLDEAEQTPVTDERPDRDAVRRLLDRIEQVLRSHDIELAEPPSVEEVEFGPRIMRVFIRPRVDVKTSSIERRSEDIALHVGVEGGGDIRIHRAPGRRGTIALDLPIREFAYEVDYQDVIDHPSFEAARRDMTLGFCAGIQIDGTPQWVDLSGMPHMLVGGATGSGKTVFLNNLIMTLALQRSPNELDLRLATSKAYDFAAFTDLPHANDTVVEPTSGTRMLIDDLVREMERRNDILKEAKAHKLDFYNEKVRRGDLQGPELPHVVAVLDEYAGTIHAFDDASARQDFESGVTRLAQEARATGIHLVLCMQRPDSEVVEGNIKSNITHRFALKLATQTDSRVVLDQNGAETLLGAGDMLYLDNRGEVHRLQVPLLEGDLLHRYIDSLSDGRPRG